MSREDPRETWRRYYANNTEKCNEASRRYQETHKEAYKAYRKAYYAKNREKMLAQAKRWREENPGYMREYMRHYYKAHREEILEKQRQRRLAKKEKQDV